MPSPVPRWTLLSAGAVAAVLALSGCSGGDGDAAGDAAAGLRPKVDSAVQEAAKKAPEPAKALPAPVQSLAAQTDVGQFLVTPNAEMPKAMVDSTVAKLKTMKGVQSVGQSPEGQVDVVFQPNVTADQRTQVVKQLAALGEVQEGI